MTDLCQWPHVDFKEPPCVERAVEGSVYCGLHSASVRRMFPMPEASRLTPERLRHVKDRDLYEDAVDWEAECAAHADAWERQLVDSGKEIERLETEIRYHQHDGKLLEEEIFALREQLRAYRGAERIAHDKLEAAE